MEIFPIHHPQHGAAVADQRTWPAMEALGWSRGDVPAPAKPRRGRGRATGSTAAAPLAGLSDGDGDGEDDDGTDGTAAVDPQT